MTSQSEQADGSAASALSDLQRAERELLDMFAHQVAGRPFGYQDIFLWGVGSRTLAQARAFRQCVEDRNSLVALAILRLQLDTVLRLYGLYWVTDPEEFAHQVFDGQQINRLKAADGQQMSDAYLRRKIKGIYPWIERVYESTSGLIHFSGRHMHSVIRLDDADTGEAELSIGPTSRHHRLSDYAEPLEAFAHCTLIVVEAVRDWYSERHTFHRR